MTDRTAETHKPRHHGGKCIVTKAGRPLGLIKEKAVILDLFQSGPIDPGRERDKSEWQSEVFSGVLEIEALPQSPKMWPNSAMSASFCRAT
jgi:hypothetical protein